MERNKTAESVTALGLAVTVVTAAVAELVKHARPWLIATVAIGSLSVLILVVFSFAIPLIAYVVRRISDWRFFRQPYVLEAAVEEAQYEGVDVTEVLRGKIRDGRLTLTVSPSDLGVTVPRKSKGNRNWLGILYRGHTARQASWGWWPDG